MFAFLRGRVARKPLGRVELDVGGAGYEVRVPDGAQDGEYRLRLRLDSRLGRQVVAANFRVDSPVPLPLFHISPTEVTLKVARDGSPFPVDLTIESHVDRELRVTARAQAMGNGGESCAELVPGDGETVGEVTFLLPPRAELGLQVQGRSSSRDGDACGILFTSEDEEQVVRATVQRSRVPETAGGLTKEARSRYDWLRLLLFILLLVLVLLILSLSKRKWVRYTTYAVVSHAALMLMAVPPTTFVNALPPSVQLTLVGQLPDEVVETTPEQARRIRDLPSVVALKDKQQPQDADALSTPEAPRMGKGPEASAPEAPATPAELAQASAPEARAEVELRQPERVRSAEATDAALSIDAPSTPAPEPVRQKTSEPAPAQASLTAAPAPLSAPPPDLPRTAFAPETRPALQQASIEVERREVPIPLSAAPTRVAAATEDLPLAMEPIQTVSSDLAAASPRKGVIDVRATPAGISSPAIRAQTVAFRVPTGGRADQPRPDAMAKGTLSPETGRAWRVHGTGTGAALTGAYERGAGKPGAGQGDVPFDLGRGHGFTKGGQGVGNGPDAPAGRLRPAGSGTATATGAGSGGGPPRLGGGTGSDRTFTIGGAGGTGASVARLGGGTSVPGGFTGGGKEGAERSGGRGGPGDAPLDLGGPGTGTAKRKAGPGKGGGGTLPTGPKVPAGGGGLTALGGGRGGPRLGGLGLGKGKVGVRAGGGGRSEVGVPLDSLSLERVERGRRGTLASSRGLRGIRPLWGPADSTTLHIRLGLARHDGDWNSSPTALFHLASAFRERCGLPALEVKVQQVELSDPAALRGWRFVQCPPTAVRSADGMTPPTIRRGPQAMISGCETLSFQPPGGIAWIEGLLEASSTRAPS